MLGFAPPFKLVSLLLVHQFRPEHLQVEGTDRVKKEHCTGKSDPLVSSPRESPQSRVRSRDSPPRSRLARLSLCCISFFLLSASVPLPDSPEVPPSLPNESKRLEPFEDLPDLPNESKRLEPIESLPDPERPEAAGDESPAEAEYLIALEDNGGRRDVNVPEPAVTW